MSEKQCLKELTVKQERIFEYIKKSICESGFPPTVREIGEMFSITVKGAYDHVKAIEKKGYIKTEQNKSRAIMVINQNPEDTIPVDAVNIPLLGQIAAGLPILAEENVSNYLTFPQSYFSKGDFFALNVRGDSMIEAGIFDGDIAVIKQQTTADNGDIVAALIEDEATLKRFKKMKDGIHLIPENPEYTPIVVKELSILGRLAAVFRNYQ